MGAALTEMQRKILAVAQHALANNGLTAFDLLSWEGLLYLREALGAQDISILIHMPDLYVEVDRALWRKARTLDAEVVASSSVMQGAATYHTDLLRSRQVEDRQ